MKKIPITKGMFALVDDEDFERVSAFKWYAQPSKAKNRITWYASRALPRVNGKQRQIKMHNFLLPNAHRVDHKNRNGLDNQKHNLREATHGQNIANSTRRLGCLSSFRGVSFSRGKWVAQGVHNRKHKHLGYFDNEELAARAYDAFAREVHGEFASLNFKA